MALSCVFRPRNDEKNNPQLFDRIKQALNSAVEQSENSKEIVYKSTWKIYGLSASSRFRKMYKETLTLDSKGFPTFESLMDNEMVQKVMGPGVTNRIYESNFSKRTNTRANFRVSLDDALAFNKSNSKKVAWVENDNGTLVIRVGNRTKANLNKFKHQYARVLMNREIESLLSPLGVSIGILEEAEARVRNGKIDFSKAKAVVEGTNALIQVANSMEGEMALTEEFSHLIVALKDKLPLVGRLIENLSGSEEAIRTILGDSYEANLEAYSGDMDLMAEEALGQLLEKHLIDNKVGEVFENSNTPKGVIESIKALFNRLRNHLLSFFKRLTPNAANKILHDADTFMDSLAKAIGEKTLNISKRDIQSTHRKVVLNSLAEQIDNSIKIVQNAITIEQKRLNITKTMESKADINDILTDLQEGILPDGDTQLALYKYMQYAIKELDEQTRQLDRLPSMEVKDKFITFRRIKSFIDSFKPTLDALGQAAMRGTRDSEGNLIDSSKTVDIEGTPTIINLYQTLIRTRAALDRADDSYRDLVIPAFAEFLKPFIGEIRDSKGNVIDIETIIRKQEGDISIFDRWLDTMANSSDSLLQAFDTVQRTQNDKARMQSLKDIRKIQAWQKKCDDAGITSFDWMFETYRDGHKTGDYIREVNYSQFYRDLDEFNKALDKKWGKNPKSAKDRNSKAAEKEAWLKTHGKLTVFGSWEPQPSVYKNNAYSSLSDTKKKLLKEYLELKAGFDALYPTNRVQGHAIQLRKDGYQRAIDVAGNPMSIFSSIKESWRKATTVTEDDDTLFGEKTVSALQGFDGRQYNVLPVLYQCKLKNPDEITTDVAQALIAYAISANQYNATEQTLDALETGRDIVNMGLRDVYEYEGKHPLAEKLKVGANTIVNQITKSHSQMEDKLNEWFESAVYQKHYAREGEFEIPLLNAKISSNKLAGILTSLASNCQLAFNWLANTANVGTGLAMMNIEAVAGQYFSPKELASADKEYFKLLPQFVGELNSRYPKGKLGLFCELFNVKYQFDNRGHESQRPSALARLFGKNVAFMGQDGGDHWLYTRAAIAMAKHQKILLNGKETSVWEALEVVDSEVGHGIKEMKFKGTVTNLDGTAFNLGAFSRKIGEVAHDLFGVYNNEDRVAAQRHFAGRLMLMYRQWMKPQFNRRFQAAHYNQTLGEIREGYYITMARMIKEMKNPVRFFSEWENLQDWEKQNVSRALFEMFQTMCVWLLAEAIQWPDDPARSWWLKYAEYMAKREVRELGNLTPSLIQFRELMATVQQPTAVLGVIQPILSFMSSLMDPMCFWKEENDWENEIQSGPYEGHSTLYKRFKKLPIPILQWINQIDKFTNRIEDRIDYYARTQAQ